MLISILTVLSILTVVSSMTVVYPKVVLTVVFIPTVAYILSGLHPHSCLHILTVVSSLSDYSPQHSPHSYFMLFSLVPILQYVCICPFNNKLTYYLLERKAVCKPATLREGKKPTQEQRAIDSFGKGFHMLKDHMLKDHVQTV